MLLKLLLRTFIFLHFPSFLENERSKFLFTEVEILPIPIELNMTITEECIHIHSNPLDQLNYHTISISSSQCIQDNELQCLSPSLLYEKEYTNNNSSFCGLQNNSTYYLYFFNDLGQSLKETIYFTTAQTKPTSKFAQVESFGSLSLTLIIGITFWTLIIYLIILVIDRQKPKTSQKGKDRKIYEVFMYNENEENLQKVSF